ncbi:MAG TPA: hypothetical protein VFN51_01310 [Candidatus Saccharimonadales bacterium]|nr:hypothetical protein [Candidatus Saccharimonadales bacterium]
MNDQLSRISYLQRQVDRELHAILEESSPRNRFERLGRNIVKMSLDQGKLPVYMAGSIVRHEVKVPTKTEGMSVAYKTYGNSWGLERRNFSPIDIAASWQSSDLLAPLMTLELNKTSIEAGLSDVDMSMLYVMEAYLPDQQSELTTSVNA